MPQLLRTVGAWQVYLDPNSNREYYCNTSTGATVWEAPPEVARTQGQARPASLLWTHGKWEVHMDASTRREYFSDSTTHATSWTCPPELQSAWAAYQTAQAPAAQQAAQAPSAQAAANASARVPYAQHAPWHLFFDEATSRTYFYNTANGQTTWDCPREVMHLVSATGGRKVVSGPRAPPRPDANGPLHKAVAQQHAEAPKLIRLEGMYQIRLGKKPTPRFVKLKEGELTMWEGKEQTGKAEAVNVVESFVEVDKDAAGSFLSINKAGKMLAQIVIEKKEDETLWLAVLEANGCNNISATLKEGTLDVKGVKKPRRITLHADRLCYYKEGGPKAEAVLLLSTSTEIHCASPMEFEVKDSNGTAKGKPGAMGFNTESMEQRDEWIAAIERVTKGLLSGVFGGQLDKGILTSERVVPTVLYESCRFLLPYVQTEGIFRVPGATARVQEFRKEYNEYRVPQMSPVDVHSVAGLVKLYFRDLPEPFIPPSTRDQMIRLNIKNGQDMDNKIPKFKALIDQLPPNIHVTLNFMCHFLTLVAAQSAENKMAADNCGMVFAPGLMKKKEVEGESQMRMGEDMAQSEACIQLMIVKYKAFFPRGPPYLPP